VLRVLLVTGVVLVAGFALLASGLVERASAASVVPAPAWQVTDLAVPSVLPPGIGRRGKYSVVVENVGGASSEGEFTIKMGVPSGFTVRGLRAEPEGGCSEEPGVLSCTISEPVVPSGFVTLLVEFEVTGSVGSVASVASVSGGGAAVASSDEARMRLGSEHEKGPAGLAGFRFSVTGPAGEPVTQAGGHPHFLTTTLLLNNMYVEGVNEPAKPVEATKDLVFYLPLGMLGDPAVADPCPASIVETRFEQTGCPSSSRVGTVLPMILNNVFANTSDPTREHGIYSVQAEKGYAAEFAFTSNHYTFFIYASVVRHNGVYMLRVATPGVPQISYLIGLVATFYGDIQERFLTGETEGVFDRGAFLSNPTDCGESPVAREASAAMNTWEHPYSLPVAEATPGFSSSVPAFSSVDGCELLGFSAGLSVKPETTQADAPSGYEVGFQFPQAPNDPTGLATPPLKDVSLTLPEGTTISPSSANGLVACAERGPGGINIDGGESEEVAADGLERPAAGHCPQASQVATVEGSTPLLHEALTGHLFLAEPGCGGAEQHACSSQDAQDGQLVGLYLELQAPGAGVVIKLKGHASLTPGSGQITTVFDESPQFPVSKLVARLKRGARAPLANPQACGTARTNATVTPWSSPTTPAATPESTFGVDWDGAGGPCPASAPFAPGFVAGGTNSAAGAASAFSLTLRREDREQNVLSLTSTLPKGLLAYLSRAARCPAGLASQASLTACPAASQVGTTTVAVGPGSDPFYATGKVFLTEPYGGAPFGLAIVVPAVAGPFNLGDVLVRVALFIDPHTLQVTAQSSPLPQELDGIPLHIRTATVTLNNNFTVNPTSCPETSITADVRSTTGASASLASEFATSGCKDLAFNPVLSGSTEAKSTKPDGTGVAIKVAYPGGIEANLAKLTLSFPTQLPVRLSTLQQACRAATFAANPATCPAASNVGTVTVHSPLISQPLVGPAYLVSNGSAKFPDVVFVLQGEGITVDVDSQSNVSNTGVLTVTVPSIPDAPFSTFESMLPRGPFSVFTTKKATTQAQASQCGENLTAHLTMVAQNGAQIAQKTKFAVAGCKPASPHISLLKAHATAHGLALTIKTTARGRLTINGTGLKTLTKRNTPTGTHQLTIPFTAAGRSAARAHQRIKIHLQLTIGKQKANRSKNITL
jgi:hypothetical protein